MTGGNKFGGAFRGRSTHRGALAVAGTIIVASSALVASPTASAAASPTPMPVIAQYQMNESSSASVMNDSGPNNLDGSIGSLVITGATYAGATGYRFNASSPTNIPADTERLVTVPDSDALDFGTSDFAVEFRYRSKVSWGNVIQKGQNQTAGGYFKFEQPNGRMTCLVKDAEGDQLAAKAPPEHATKDGDWHTIRCEKTKNQVLLFVDGVEVAKTGNPNKSVDSVSNSKVLSIGGKSSCDQIDVTCDYFNGDIDWVKIEKKGGSGSVNQPPDAAFSWSCDDRDCDFDSSDSDDPDGSITSRSWDFGDGSNGSGTSPSHVYAEGGQYTVQLTVVDNDGGIGVVDHTVTVNRPPVMSFTPSCDHLACTFDSAASADPDGTIASRTWKFGDSTTGTGVAPGHTFTAAGTYLVELTGTDDDGATTTVSQSVIVTANGAPTMTFTNSCTNLSCAFDSSASTDSDGTIASRTWKFGDSTTGIGVAPGHTFTAAGTYLVELTGTDDDGATTTVTRSVTVTASASQPPTPTPGEGGSSMTTVTSFRLFDTRPGETPPGPKGIVEGGTPIDVQVAGVGVIPDGVTAVAINLTVVALEAPSHVTVWPTGTPRPTLVSSINVVTPNTVRANLAIIPVGKDGKISVFSLRDAHVLGDVVGYFTEQAAGVKAGRIITKAPQRLFDTRPGSDPGPKGLVPAGDKIAVNVLGQAGLPTSGVDAVILNLTATETQAAGFVTAWSGVGAVPKTSSLNVNGLGETVANMVIVPVADDGTIKLYSLSGTHLLADVLGYVTDASATKSTEGLFVPLAPARVFDTRESEPAPGPKGMIQSDDSITTEIAGVGDIPNTAGGVVLNLTMVSTAPGFITMWPTGDTRRVTSNVNATVAGDVRANGAILALGDGGDLDAYALTAAHLIGDVFGYLLA